MRLGIKKSACLALFLSAFLSVHFASADVIGQQVKFNANTNFDKYRRTSFNATLRYAGARAYFYIDNGFWDKLDNAHRDSLLANISVLSSEFDNNIYPKETALWGSEPNPGVDGDPKLTILLEELIENNGGYFDTSNAYTSAQVIESNQREMIALNVDVLTSDDFVPKMFLTHEFQHLISFNQKEKKYKFGEDVWLNELRSEYSISAVGYNNPFTDSNLDRRVYLFSSSQGDSLTEWLNKNDDYSTVALFAEYLVEQFGQEILSKTLQSPYYGIASINKYLEGKTDSRRFDDIYLKWLAALYLNDNSIDAELGYKRTELKNIKASPEKRVFLSSSLSEYSVPLYLKDFQPSWTEFDLSSVIDSGKSLKIDLQGDYGQTYLASYLAYYDSGLPEYGTIKISGSQGTGYIIVPAGKKLNKLVVIASKATKNSGFTNNEYPNSLNIKSSLVDTKIAESNTLKDGVLIKRPNEKELYVIRGKYKRYLNPEIIKLYGHLDPSSAIELAPEVFDSYTSSNYVRYVNDEKVYAIWPDGTRHWLNISARYWDDSGRDWNSIFIINDLELNKYKLGAEITR